MKHWCPMCGNEVHARAREHYISYEKDEEIDKVAQAKGWEKVDEWREGEWEEMFPLELLEN